MWCLGRIAIPPHCPIDAVVLKQVPDYKGDGWTKLDSIDEYKDIIYKVKARAGNMKLAKWELEYYNTAYRS